MTSYCASLTSSAETLASKTIAKDSSKQKILDTGILNYLVMMRYALAILLTFPFEISVEATNADGKLKCCENTFKILILKSIIMHFIYSIYFPYLFYFIQRIMLSHFLIFT